MEFITFRDFQFNTTTYCLVVGMEWAQKQIDQLDSSQWVAWSYSRLDKESLLANDRDNLNYFFEVSKCNIPFDEFVDTVIALITAFYYLNGGNSEDYKERFIENISNHISLVNEKGKVGLS